MKDKLHNINFRITELSVYLNISRPTLYKYLDSYTQKKYTDIDRYTLDVFKFINLKSTTSKLQVIDYIIKTKERKYQLNSIILEKLEKCIDDTNKEHLLFDILDFFSDTDKLSILEEVIKKYKGEEKND
jgi:hypothetical protein